MLRIFDVRCQVRLSAAEERATRAEWERRDAVTGLERQLAAARAEVLDWRREVVAAEAERDKLAADKKLLAQRGSSGSLYAGYNGTPKARGACPQPYRPCLAPVLLGRHHNRQG